MIFKWEGFSLCISSGPLLDTQHFCFFRDKLSSDDCIGTYYLPMSAISGQGEEGWCTVYRIVYFFRAQVSQAYWNAEVYIGERVRTSSSTTTTTTATTAAVTSAAVIYNDNFNDFKMKFK